MAAGGLQPTSRIDRAITFHHIWAPDISDAYYKCVTDTIFSLLLLIANPSRVTISYWFTSVRYISCCSTAASNGGARGGRPRVQWESEVNRSELADKEEG